MKVTGFSFIKNAIIQQYPIEEALRSILPICDEIVVAVGKSEDDTRGLVASIDPKIRIIDTVWDESLRTGGKVLADETNKAFQAIGADSDWCVYIQGDEVMHEDGHGEVLAAMKKWKDHKQVDGLLLKYLHFFGSYDYVGIESKWYRNEIRVIRNDKSFWSYRDAQGFRKDDNEKLRVKPVNAYIYHYGWVHSPKGMKSKIVVQDRINHDKETENDQPVNEDFPLLMVNALKRFEGRHPKVMQERVAKMNWNFKYDLSKNKLPLNDRLKNLLEKITGKRFFDYKNYKIV
jgi:hypothetical protein